VANKSEIKLSDYQKPEYLITDTFLNFDIDMDKTQVLSVLKMKKNGKHEKALKLNGENLNLLKVTLNGDTLGENSIQVTDTHLIISDLPDDEFTLSTLVEIAPSKNLTGEGLYKSGNILCTQNEAEGFRKITYYLDRPDVMAPFTTSISANKKDFPYILANGNKISEKDEGDRHTVVWKDPHPKPCYLFALVAGNLDVVRDTFTTCSGKNVDLEIYVDPGNTDKCTHAMESLKNSMKWDEEVFGLEYDLSLYMIVAVDSFNMGAMENKGLNIFNSAYVLAKKETATDSDFQGIEAVIGHEYFHNWTGNRVTCRDWFQLTLKEGLTVFRDQEFSSDMLSRPVKRIEDVLTLRRHQFKEDAGPLSHPIQPKSYIEINNFYTATVYEKGAEVIRMIHTLLGKENFRKGMDLYFERHDGQAVTTQDFVQAMSDASSIDLTQFKLWYDQNGTPEVKVKSERIDDKLELTIEQFAYVNEKRVALHFPFDIALIDIDGKLIYEKRHEIKEETTKLVIDAKADAVISLNRNFTAPIKVHYQYDEKELLHILKYETDEFNKYDASQSLYKQEIFNYINAFENNSDYNFSDSLINALNSVLSDTSLDNAFKSYVFSLPTESEINEEFPIYKIEATHEALKALKLYIAKGCEDTFKNVYNNINQTEFKLDAKSMGERQLKNTALAFLAQLNSNHQLAISHFENANNMTDEISALSVIVKNNISTKEASLESFYQKWKHETLIMQKWIALQAGVGSVTIADLEKLESNSVYDAKNPNLLRSLVGAFANNVIVFNQASGEGYKFMARKIAEIDAFNPQIAARLAKFMNHKKRLDETRKKHLNNCLDQLMKSDLSADTYEVVLKNVKD
tara:strand:- start:110612 stop:113173 length:2562 start_codon:yes stop_codon:yes gene_type:complete